jgi:hypothetical protein
MNLSIKKHLALAAMIFAVAALGTGCSGAKAPAPTGGARVSIDTSGLAVAANVAVLNVSVSPAGLTFPLTKASNGLSWTGFISGLPAGSQTFAASAYDLSNNLLYSGSTTVTIVAGQAAMLVIILEDASGTKTTTENVPVISAFTASNVNPIPSILPGAPSTVQLNVTATDPNVPAGALTYAWTASCTGTDNGTFSAANVANPVWTAPSTTPGPTNCTISATVTNSKGSSVQTFMTIKVALTNGSANITAYVNTNPVITSLYGKFVYQGGAQTGDITLAANDPDGDNLAYAWSSPCVGTGLGTLNTSAPYTQTTPHFTLNNTTSNCTFTVLVTDLCTNGNCGGANVAASGARTDGSPRGGQVTGILNAKAPAAAQGYPQITNVTEPVGGTIDAAGATVQLGVAATDPQGGALSFAWSLATGTGGTLLSSSLVTGASSSLIQFVAPNPLAASMPVLVKVTSAASALTTTYTFNLVPANTCIGAAAGTHCSTGSLCVVAGTETCTAGVCGGGTPTAASACTTPGACQTATGATCNATTGACVYPTVANNTSCSGDSCNPATCQAGTCTAGTPVTCTAATSCQTNTGATCVGTGTSPVCNYPNLTSGTPCSTNLCTPAACNGTGTCVNGTPVTCTTPGLCQTATGAACTPATGLCAYPAAAVGTTCVPTVTPACTTGFACTATQTCVGTQDCTVSSTCCSAGQACNPTSKVCVSPTPTPTLSALFPTASIAAAGGQTGNVYLVGPLFGTQSVGTIPVTSDGSADVVVAKYTAVSTTPVWAVHFGGGAAEASAATDQIPVAAAVTQDETVVVIGSTSGNIVVNGTAVSFPAAPQDFILGVNGATGAGKFALPVANGTGGALLAVAANPTKNIFAVCGFTNTVSSLAQAGVVAPTGTQATDAVIAVYTSAGTLVWSKQIASPSYEACNSAAVDDNGDVYFAGNYGTVAGSTSIDPGLGALPVTGLASRRFMWVAKYNGATGAIIAQNGYGPYGLTGTAANGVAIPMASTVDATGRLILGGKFTNTLPFGTGANTLAPSGQDGFIANLAVGAGATQFTTNWAVRLGGTGNSDQVAGVAATSTGEVLATGTYALTSTGALTLTSSGSSDDIFVLQLDGATGATLGQQTYGDPSAQAGAAILCNRSGTTNKDLVDFVGTLSGTVAFGTTPALTSAATAGYLVVAPLQ